MRMYFAFAEQSLLLAVPSFASDSEIVFDLLPNRISRCA